MKTHTAYLTINHPDKTGFIHLTPQVEEAVRKSGVREGIALINSMHITSSVFVNDNERGLHHDFGVWLEKLAPFNPDPNVYHHNRTGEDNADAHLKRTIMGREVVVAITNGKPGREKPATGRGCASPGLPGRPLLLGWGRRSWCEPFHACHGYVREWR